MRRPRIRKLTSDRSGNVLSLSGAIAIARTFAHSDFLEMIGQLNNGICTPTLFAADAIISDRLHRGLVTFNRWKKFTDIRVLGVPKSAARSVPPFLPATAFAAFTKRHSALDFIQSRGRTLRYSRINLRP